MKEDGIYLLYDGDAENLTLVDGDSSIEKIVDGEPDAVEQVHVETEYYDGPTTITPTDSTQILQTANKTVAGNITVEPIPSNYGKITYNGSFLTVE